MDKIVLSDEEKEKIITKALLKTKAHKRPVYRYAANIAAGVIICLISIPATEFLLKPAPDYVPAITLTPSPTETPSVLSPLAPTAASDADTSDKSTRQTEAPAQKTTARPVSKQSQAAPVTTARPAQQTATPRPAKKISDTPAAKEPAVQRATPTAVTAAQADNAQENAVSGASARSASPRAAVSSEQSVSETDLHTPAALSETEEENTSDAVTQIVYTNGTSEFVYRTQPGSEDCSGDFNDYENSDEIVCGDKNVTLKTDSNYGTLVVWNDDDASFSLHTDTILTPEEVSDLISDF